MAMPQVKEPGPFSAMEWMISLRYLRARRKEGFISVIAGFSFVGILLGVATLIIVMSVMNGFRKELFHKILGLNGHVIVRPIEGGFKNYQDAAARLRKVEGVRNVLSVIDGQVLLSSPLRSTGAVVRGLDETDFKSLEAISSKVFFGTLDNFDHSGGIAIGSRLARSLGVRLNDEVTVVAPRGAATPFGTQPRVKRYPVKAIFEIGMSEYDSTIVFMPLAEAQAFFNSKGMVDVLELLVADADRVDALRPALVAAAGANMKISDWRERNATFYDTLKIERNVMFIILTMIVLVAALNIVCGMIMLVKDKGRDIAILRTMGATQGAIMRIFFITGSSIGIVGTLGGFIVGVVFCAYIDEIKRLVGWLTRTQPFDPGVYFLTKMPAQMDPTEVGAVVLMALTLSVLATLYPSWRAARLDPVEALRYE